jgi:AAA family ATP:ADP antiporter
VRRARAVAHVARASHDDRAWPRDPPRAQSIRVTPSDRPSREPAAPRLRLVVVSAATFAALLASYTAFRPVRDSLVFDKDPDNLPWLFLCTFAAMSVASPAWSALLARRPGRSTVPVVFHVFALCALAFFAIIRAGVAPITVGRVFYVWSAVFNLFVVSVFWSLLADLLGPGAARRLYGPIAAGGTIGSLIGPLLTRTLVGSIGEAGVLVMSAALLELAVLGVAGVRRAATGIARENAEEPPPAPGGALTGVVHVARSRYLSSIVGYVLCTACAATFMYLAQARIVHDALSDRTARTTYLADIDVWVAAVTLALQTLIAAPALGRFGPAVVLAVLPIAQAVGVSVLAAAPSLTALAVVQVIGRASTHGLTRPARELLFTVLDRDDKYRAKNAIDTIAYRFGDVGASWLYQGLAVLGTGGAALVGVTLPLAAIWLALAVVLGAGFRRRVAGRSAPPTPEQRSSDTAAHRTSPV